MLTPQEQLILLSRLPSVGAGAYWRMLEHFPNLATALDAPFAQLQPLIGPDACEQLKLFRVEGTQSLIWQQVQRDLEWCDAHQVHLVHLFSETYPYLLREIKRAPPLLYVQGNPDVLAMPQVAVVGSRNPTAGGRDNAFQFSETLAAGGIVVTSGLALGVDLAAHQGALKAPGKTIAVLGTGLDQIYPRKHEPLARQIVEAGGAVISEFPLGVGPFAANFPQRNRIISGLSLGVVVVEAAVKSGSLITARYALQQNREVFAIPGSIHNPLSRGCHALIKDGAKLVETAKDVMDELQGFLAFKWQESRPIEEAARLTQKIVSELVENEHESTVLQYLSFDPVTLDNLVMRSGLGAGELMAALLTLELKGLVGNVGVGYARTSPYKKM